MSGVPWSRRGLLESAGAILALAPLEGWSKTVPYQPASVSDAVLSAVLSAGNWSTTADDNGSNERVKEASARAWVQAASGPAPDKQAIVDLGALALTLAVAEWGVDWEGSGPEDPAAKHWTGPASIKAGKHLMSYALGGIGLPHLDTGAAIAFFRHLAATVPDDNKLATFVKRLPANFTYDRIRAAGGVCAPIPEKAVLMKDSFGELFHHDAAYFGGANYCARFDMHGSLDAAGWQEFRSWARLGLRRRDMQRWIVETWINSFWLPAYAHVMAQPHGSLAEVFVVARIWNSGKGLAIAAVSAAASSNDPTERIRLELDDYGRRKPTYRDRRGVMQRPAVVFEHMAKSK